MRRVLEGRRANPVLGSKVVKSHLELVVLMRARGFESFELQNLGTLFQSSGSAFQLQFTPLSESCTSLTSIIDKLTVCVCVCVCVCVY